MTGSFIDVFDMGNRMASFSSSLKCPIVVVLGATGTGKSKLAIQLAKTFNGEIISADSMQVYKGLDIITNKVTVEEQNQIVHHFIGMENPLKQFTVVDFQNKALRIINNLHQEFKLPIIVGGTNYYIESLLWDVLIKQNASNSDALLLDKEKRESTFSLSSDEENQLPHLSLADDVEFNELTTNILQNVITQDSHKNIPSQLLHKVLSKVDPSMANTLHPNDRRKILRSLQVYQQHKCRHTELIQQQKSQIGGSSLGGPLRYKNSVMLWVHCDKSALHKRLDDRVEQMIEAGLIEELLGFHKMYNESRINSESKIYEEGIFQSIGFKEFQDYLLLSSEEKNTEKGVKMLQKGMENMKITTKQYARKQIKWITNRFLRKPDRELPPVYLLNATDSDEWDEHVFRLAKQIVNAFLQIKESGILPLAIEERIEDVKETHYCDICDRIIVGKTTWQIHLKSKKHHKTKKSLKKSCNLTKLESEG